jgi:hypothetical protein
VAEGTLDVKYASHLQSPDAAANYDDGWFGYGTFAPPPPPKKITALKESKTPSKIDSSKADQESDRPTFVRRHASSSSDSSSGSASASRRPTRRPVPAIQVRAPARHRLMILTVRI